VEHQALLDHIHEEPKLQLGKGFSPAPFRHFAQFLAPTSASPSPPAMPMPTTLADHFPIQSICTRLFGLMLAMSRCDDQAWILVGKEPPGTVFNSLAVE
jgi:hypothetical protein